VQKGIDMLSIKQKRQNVIHANKAREEV